MIEIKNVVKSFDGFHALDGTNITVPDGSIYVWWAPTAPGSPR